ncbi:hypothetical protein NBRC116597_32510 [Phaeobacter sp. NW0010-22]
MSYDECYLRWGAISLVDGLIAWQSDWQVKAMKHLFAPIGILNTHPPLSQTSAALPRSPLPPPHGEGAWVVIGRFTYD